MSARPNVLNLQSNILNQYGYTQQGGNPQATVYARITASGSQISPLMNIPTVYMVSIVNEETRPITVFGTEFKVTVQDPFTFISPPQNDPKKVQLFGNFTYEAAELLQGTSSIIYAGSKVTTGEITSRETEIQKIFQSLFPKETKWTTFADVETNKWYAPAITWLNQKGIIRGYGDTGLFGPANFLQRVELEKSAQLYFSTIILGNTNNFISDFHNRIASLKPPPRMVGSLLRIHSKHPKKHETKPSPTARNRYQSNIYGILLRTLPPRPGKATSIRVNDTTTRSVYKCDGTKGKMPSLNHRKNQPPQKIKQNHRQQRTPINHRHRATPLWKSISNRTKQRLCHVD